MSEIGILIVDDDAANQSALKSVLDSEGWRVRIVADAQQALAELATGAWNLAIANIAVADLGGPLFAILRELSEAAMPSSPGDLESPRKQLRVLFLVPARLAASVQPVLESEGLPYSLKPYHLHEFFEKVSDLLVESGAIEEPIRAMGNFAVKRRPVRRLHSSSGSRYSRRAAMFASREDYQMTEEEMAEYERQEEEERKKREKAQKDRERL